MAKKQVARNKWQGQERQVEQQAGEEAGEQAGMLAGRKKGLRVGLPGSYKRHSSIFF